MPSKRAGRGKRYHHGDLKRALLREALLLVTERGAEGVTLREAARRAGVTQAAPYRHFQDKADLLAAVAEEGFRDLDSEMRAARDAAGSDVMAQLAAMGIAYVRFAAGKPAHFRVMFGPDGGKGTGHPHLQEAADLAFLTLMHGIEQAQRMGLLRPDEPKDVALTAWSTMHGLAELLVYGLLDRRGMAAGPGRSLESVAGHVTELLMGGLRRR